MFLDPIALLSAECPRLDMGLLYSAMKSGRVVEKYTAVAPAAGHSFVPTGTGSVKFAADAPSNTYLANGVEETGASNIVTAILLDYCTICRKPATDFRDDLSRKEYTLSGFCQTCQDDFFTDDP